MAFNATRNQAMIPKPTGPYAVGCTDIMTSPGPEGILFRLFYPTVSVEGAESPKWLPDKEYLKGYARYFNLWPPVFTYLFPAVVGEVHVPASWNTPPLRSGQQQFPVIVFSHGLGASRTTYTALCLQLASDGYIVAAVEHRDYSASASFYFEEPSETNKEDKESQKSQKKQGLKKKFIFLKKVKSDSKEPAIRNKQVHIRSKECSLVLDWLHRLNDGADVNNVLETSFLLNQFQNLLDFSRASIGGHSFGGATAIVTMAEDKRFKVGFGLDPWMIPLCEETSIFKDITQQMLFVDNEVFQTEDDLKTMKKIASSCPNLLKVTTLKGTVHLNQCDVPFICSAFLRWFFGSNSRMDRFQAMDLTTRLTTVFLSKHLDLPVNENYVNYLKIHQDVMSEGIITDV